MEGFHIQISRKILKSQMNTESSLHNKNLSDVVTISGTYKAVFGMGRKAVGIIIKEYARAS